MACNPASIFIMSCLRKAKKRQERQCLNSGAEELRCTGVEFLRALQGRENFKVVIVENKDD